MLKGNELFFIYENEKGLLDTLKYNLDTNYLEEDYDIDKRDLPKGINYSSHLVSQELFKYLQNLFENECSSSSTYVEDEPYEQRENEYELEQKKIESQPLTAKEVIQKAIHFDLSLTESIHNAWAIIFEKDHYYDFKIIYNTFLKLNNDEISMDAFAKWAYWMIIAIRNDITYNEETEDIFEEIIDYFDGNAFMSNDDKNEYYQYFYEELANIKYLDYKLKNVKKKKIQPMINYGRYIIYTCTDYFYDDTFNYFIIIDKKNKRFNIVIERNHLFDPRLNYNFIAPKKYLSLIDEDMKYDENLTFLEIMMAV